MPDTHIRLAQKKIEGDIHGAGPKVDFNISSQSDIKIKIQLPKPSPFLTGKKKLKSAKEKGDMYIQLFYFKNWAM